MKMGNNTSKVMGLIFRGLVLAVLLNGACMAAILNISTNQNGIGARIYVDGRQVVGINGNRQPQDTMTSSEGLFIKVDNEQWHEIYLKKQAPDGSDLESPRRNVMGSSSEILSIYLPIKEVSRDPYQFFILIRPEFSATIRVDSSERALVGAGERYRLEFHDQGPHNVTVVDNSDGKVFTYQVGRADNGKEIFVTRPKVPIEWIAVGGGLALCLVILTLVVVRSRRKTQISPPPYRSTGSRSRGNVQIQGGQAPAIQGWPEFMRYNYANFKPVKFLKSGGIGGIWVVQNLEAPKARKKEETLVKILYPQFSNELTREAQRFMDEALVLHQLKDTGMVPEVYARSIDQPAPGVQLWFEMEYLKNWTELRQSVGGKLEKTLSINDSIQLYNLIIKGVKELHKRGYLHRDLSPENVMILKEKKTYKVKLIDFGTVKVPDRDDSDLDYSTERTTRNEYLGKIKYCGEEQWSGGLSGAVKSTDYYAAAIMLWEMIVGRVPYPERNFSQDVLTPLTQKGVDNDLAKKIAALVSPGLEDRKKAYEVFGIEI